MLTPNSFGVRVREFNPCHDSMTGRFAAKGSGNCDPCTYCNQVEPTYVDKRTRRQVLRLAKRQGSKSFSTVEAMRMMGPDATFAIGQLMARSADADTEMRALLEKAASTVGGKVLQDSRDDTEGAPTLLKGPVKGLHRVIVKALSDYDGDFSKVIDVARATVTVDSAEDVPAVVDLLRGVFKVVRAKDTSRKPTEAGYRDFKLNIRLSNGMTGEVIVATRSMVRAKEGEGHKLYGQARVLKKNDPRRQQLNAQMKRLYDSAHEAALKKSRTVKTPEYPLFRMGGLL